MYKLDFSYNDDIVLAGNGGVSEELINNVARILENNFQFKGIKIAINANISNIKPFLDSEPRARQERSSVQEDYKDKYVFILQNLKIFDNRLEHKIQDIENDLKRLGIQDANLKESIETLRYLGLPDMVNKVAPRFTSSRFNPSSMEKQIIGQINAAKMGRAKHISVVIPKTIFEWSHHFIDKWREENVYEMAAYHDFLEHICLSGRGADSVIILHPHAPKEGLEISRIFNLNYVMIYPQTYTLSSNGWIYSIDDLFKGFSLNSKAFDPIGHKIKEDKAKLGELSNISHLLLYVSSVDDGSRLNAERAAQRFGLGYVKSAKHRNGEGDSKITESDDIGIHLKKLEKYTQNATITTYIFDDMINSGGTINAEAEIRKQQVADYNKANNTEFSVNIEVIVTHLRLPELNYLKHNNTDKITIFDSVPFLPHIDDQLQSLGLDKKVHIIKHTANQLAMGIALDYFAQKAHLQLERDLETGRHREATDKDLVKHCNYGQDLENMMRTLETTNNNSYTSK